MELWQLKNGITRLLAKPYSPTTTWKVERWHQTPASADARRANPRSGRHAQAPEAETNR